ncbi:hypothetical protein ACFLV7_03300 [Chloroflexota bacterium]
MGRVINPERPGKIRARLLRVLVIALEEYKTLDGVNVQSYDIAAFIALTLIAISQTAETTASAWEKRDYWIKADRFRNEWKWVSMYGNRMQAAVLDGDYSLVNATATDIFEFVSDIEVPKRHRLGTPWSGAYQELRKKSGNTR